VGSLSGYVAKYAKAKRVEAVTCGSCGASVPADNDFCPECGVPVEPVGKTGARYDPACAGRAEKMVLGWLLRQSGQPITPGEEPVTEDEKILDVLTDLVHYCNREGLSLPLLADEAANTVNGPPEESP